LTLTDNRSLAVTPTRETSPSGRLLVSVMRLAGRRDTEAALREAFAAGTGDHIVVIGPDGIVEPGAIERFVAALRADCNFSPGA